jgi:uncharacterized protein (TIGR03000 family)
VVLLLALSGQTLAAPPPHLYGDGGIPWSPPANSVFEDSLNAPPGNSVVAVYVSPAAPPPVAFRPVVIQPAAPVAEPALLLVHVPADARLFIDGTPTRSPGDTRLFISPPLSPGRSYHYLLRAEVVRDGKKYSARREVTVRPGEESEVQLTVPATTTQTAGR